MWKYLLEKYKRIADELAKDWWISLNNRKLRLVKIPDVQHKRLIKYYKVCVRAKKQTTGHFYL